MIVSLGHVTDHGHVHQNYLKTYKPHGRDICLCIARGHVPGRVSGRVNL